jgi:hypothetical protein
MLGVAGIRLAVCAVFTQLASRIPSLITSFRKSEAVEIAQAPNILCRCVALLSWPEQQHSPSVISACSTAESNVRAHGI